MLLKIYDGTVTLDDQEEALKDPMWAYNFAMNVKGANIEKCEAAACKDCFWSYKFARDVPGANIRNCQKHASKHLRIAYMFVHDIPGADVSLALRACKGTEYEEKLNLYLMDKALL